MKTDSVTKTIEGMIKQYPSLFHNRTEALNHLFLTIGNGYDWIDGELKDSSSEEETEIDTQLYKRKQKQDREILNTLDRLCDTTSELIKVLSDFKKGKEQEVKNKKNYHQLARLSVPTWNQYPVSVAYSYVFQVPALIKPEWSQARKEIALAVLTSPQKDQTALKNKELIRRYLPEIHKEHKS